MSHYFSLILTKWIRIGHGSVFTVSATGGLEENVQNYELVPGAGVHGAVFDANEDYLYSADLSANKIWVHAKSKDGTLKEVGSHEAFSPKDHPRWAEISPNGRYLWVLMEGSDVLREYEIDQETHLLKEYTGDVWPLRQVTEGEAPEVNKMYRADVVTLTSSGKYLFATCRANSYDLKGYITAFSIEQEGPRAGRIGKQIFLVETETSGGHSNAVSPCKFNPSH
jgi:carboxy-cis,cis-muconate cyclase